MRQRKSFERKEGVKSARLVVIAAEGRKTENIYFDAMKHHLCASGVYVVVLRRSSNTSNPEAVYAQIREFMNKYLIEEDDQLWVVVDKDRWKDKMLSNIAQHCSQNDNLYFCVSNPCFELWLLLHLEDVVTYDDKKMNELRMNKKVNSSETWLKNYLKQLMGHYRESDYDADSLLRFINDAIARAEHLDSAPKDRWPQDIGTRVYLLAWSIMT